MYVYSYPERVVKCLPGTAPVSLSVRILQGLCTSVVPSKFIHARLCRTPFTDPERQCRLETLPFSALFCKCGRHTARIRRLASFCKSLFIRIVYSSSYKNCRILKIFYTQDDSLDNITYLLILNNNYYFNKFRRIDYRMIAAEKVKN